MGPSQQVKVHNSCLSMPVVDGFGSLGVPWSCCCWLLVVGCCCCCWLLVVVVVVVVVVMVVQHLNNRC